MVGSSNRDPVVIHDFGAAPPENLDNTPIRGINAVARKIHFPDLPTNGVPVSLLVVEISISNERNDLIPDILRIRAKGKKGPGA